MSIININNYKTRILYLRAMVLQRLKQTIRWLKDYLYEVFQVCRGYELCIHDDCEYYVHIDDPTFPECRQCYREHAAEELTSYVMDQIAQLQQAEHLRERSYSSS